VQPRLPLEPNVSAFGSAEYPQVGVPLCVCVCETYIGKPFGTRVGQLGTWSSGSSNYIGVPSICYCLLVVNVLWMALID
jgi:hypothetical protein